VLQFQQTHNLAADGIAGDQTLTILSAAVSEAEAGRDFSSTGGLATGSQGTAVAELQTLLREAGYFNGTVTGFFGPETDAAVRQFQQASGLSVDGIAGQRTIAALRGNIPTTASSSSSSSSTTSVAADGSLSPGAEGILVSSLQEQLALLGFYRGTVDGLYGPQTVAAVEAFQTAHGLTTSGVADPTTQARIDQQILTQAQDPGTVAATTTAPAMPLRPEPSSSSAFTVTPVPTNLSRPPAINPSVVVPSSSTVTASPSSGTNYSVMPPSSSQINTSQSSIRELQEQLREMDFYSGSVDGQLGPSTNEAIREAQQRYGISPSDFE
jgi:peptidoglycan hydrolase-like protein with peptidoglycan-binding domain